jgi:hypothetical protein
MMPITMHLVAVGAIGLKIEAMQLYILVVSLLACHDTSARGIILMNSKST